MISEWGLHSRSATASYTSLLPDLELGKGHKERCLKVDLFQQLRSLFSDSNSFKNSDVATVSLTENGCWTQQVFFSPPLRRGPCAFNIPDFPSDPWT